MFEDSQSSTIPVSEITAEAVIAQQKTLGEALARTLLDELHPSDFPEPISAKKEEWSAELYGVVAKPKEKGEGYAHYLMCDIKKIVIKGKAKGFYLYRVKEENTLVIKVLVIHTQKKHETLNLTELAQEQTEKDALDAINWPDSDSAAEISGVLVQMILSNWQGKKKKEKSEKSESDEEFQFKTAEGKLLPKRGGIVDFQTHAGKKLPKSVFAPLISADATCTELYCIAFGGFIPEGCMSIEHAYPHTKIRENQVRLLNYLNDKGNEVIANSFLAYPGIADYIKRDVDGQIKGSLYFFKHSYGAMTNLYLLGQGENSSKGAKNLFEWIEKEENPILGKKFIAQVQ